MGARNYLRLRFFALAILTVAGAVFATSPLELPGEELTDRRIQEARMRRLAGIVDTAGEVSREERERSQLERAMSTWHAPTISAQMSADETIIPFGKGGIFVPRMTEINMEPDVEVFDISGVRIGSIETGRTMILEAGDYRVTLGSGNARQRIEKRVTVVEGRATPVIPDWAGLVIDVVDENGIMLRGEYELVRIDEFDPYGRGYGASIELGEVVRAWILTPGIYKILGAGESYNSLQNFVTVRLMPGEFTTFLLIQDPNDFRIRGGGTVYLTPTTSITSNWRFGLNVGANVQLNLEIDHETEAELGNTSVFTSGIIFDTWVQYRKRPVEWLTRLRFDEGINITDNDVETMVNSPDRVTMSSIFIWRILNWFGPYARAEFNTKFFSTRIRRSSEDGFVFVDANYYIDESKERDTSQTFAIEPAFSPLIFEVGAGVSADITVRSFFELRSRLGFANAFSRYADRHRVIESSRVLYHDEEPSIELYELVRDNITLYPEEEVSIFETGPQMSLGALLRLGTSTSIEGEVKVFAPIYPDPRLSKPDLEINATLSWRLSRILNLDYTYRQSLRQPVELDVPIHTSTHGIWLRLHYSSR